MPFGNCRLCQNPAELQHSHVVPAFAYRWLRESSGNGHLRTSANPNLRVQDGPKEYWLCLECEGIFGRSETSFANQLFHPYLVHSGQRFNYGPWLLHFCTSVSWRTLQFHLDRERNNETEFTAVQFSMLENAETCWRNFLLGNIAHPGLFRQHLIPFDQIESTSRNLPPNINRYLMRAIQIDLCHGGETIFVFTKIGRFAILGFVNEPNPNHWVGTRINANQGNIEPRDYQLPMAFMEYLIDKANNLSGVRANMSERQIARVDQSFRSNIDRIIDSDFFNAMQADVNMFGSDAFLDNSSDN